MVNNLKKENELEIDNSDKSGNGWETTDFVKQFNLDEPNQMKAKRTKG